MRTFAFLFNPVDLKHIRDSWPITRMMPDFFVKSFLKNQGFKISQLKNFKSCQGQEIQGYFIVSPLLPEQMVEMDEELILEKIITASYLARDMGAELLGLGGYASVVADKKPMLYKHLKTPVTSGTSLTAWSVIEALHRSAKAKKLDPAGSTLAVNGALSSIGSLCSRRLAANFARTIICDKDKEKLEELRQSILQLAPAAEVEISQDARRAVRNAEVVISASIERNPEYSLEDIKPGCLLLDISLSRRLSARNSHRPDLTIIEGGVMKLPPLEHSPLYSGLAKDLVYASVAETMILAFEERFTTCSLGENINLDKLELIADLAVRHGFEVFVPNAPIV